MNPVQILLTTCPRHGVNPYGYFFRTLQDINDQLNAWGTLAEHDVTLTISIDPDRVGYVEALRRRLARDVLPGYDVLWLEDDLQFCKNAIRYMCEYRQRCDAAFTAFFECRHFRQRVPWPEVPGDSHVYHVPMSSQLAGLQAVLFPAFIMEQLRARSERDPLPDRIRPNDADIAVSWWLKDASHFCVHMPNLVQHVGDKSVLLDGDGKPVRRVADEFRSQNYPGAEFDAMTLQRGPF